MGPIKKIITKFASVVAVMLGGSIFSSGQSVLLWSKCYYSFQMGIGYTTLPSLRFSTLSDFPLPSLRELLWISYF